MSTDTKIKTLIFNKLTQEQYNNADKVPTEFYLTPDTSIDSSEKGAANGVATLDVNCKVPTEQIPAATTSTLGGVKPDGNTITVTEDGTISAIGGSGPGTAGLSIGDVVYSYSSLSSENPGKLPLFTGETIASANTIYPEFYSWISAHTELQCTTEEYEASLTTYGECVKYATKFPVTNTAYKYNLTGLSNALSSNYSFYKKNENGDYEAISDQTYYYTNEEFIIEPLESNEPTVFLDEKCAQKLYAEYRSGGQVQGYYEVRLILVGPNSVKLKIFLSDVSGLFIAPSSGSVTPSTIKNTETILTSTTYEVNGSLRLPLIKNYIKAANPSEGIKNIEAGLPDHTHKTPYGKNDNGDYHAQGGARPHISTNEWFGTIYGYSKDRNSASASNPIYGKSSTVTPASTTLYPWVVAYTAAIPASTAQAAEFQQGLSGKADTNLGNVPSNYDYVMESYNEGTNWYRKYKSGWVEQGGVATSDNVTLLKPMENANYSVYMSQAYNDVDYSAYSAQPHNRTTTSFSYFQYQGKFNAFWYVCGKGAN